MQLRCNGDLWVSTKGNKAWLVLMRKLNQSVVKIFGVSIKETQKGRKIKNVNVNRDSIEM